jgi:hypothetical protein
MILIVIKETTFHNKLVFCTMKHDVKKINIIRNTVKPVLCDFPREHWNWVTQDRWSLNTGLINMKGKLKLRSHNMSYCLKEVVIKAGLTIIYKIVCWSLNIHQQIFHVYSARTQAQQNRNIKIMNQEMWEG